MTRLRGSLPSTFVSPLTPSLSSLSPHFLPSLPCSPIHTHRHVCKRCRRAQWLCSSSVSRSVGRNNNNSVTARSLPCLPLSVLPKQPALLSPRPLTSRRLIAPPWPPSLRCACALSARELRGWPAPGASWRCSPWPKSPCWTKGGAWADAAQRAASKSATVRVLCGQGVQVLCCAGGLTLWKRRNEEGKASDRREEEKPSAADERRATGACELV